MTSSIRRSPDSLPSWEELKLDRLRELKRLREQKRAARQAGAEARLVAEYGERVGPGLHERVEDGVLVSSMVCETPDGGRLVYRLIGVSSALDLL